MVFDSSLFRYAPAEPCPYGDWTDIELMELFEERSAVAEYDGGLSRQVADANALEWLKNEIGESRFKVWCSKPNNVQSEKVAASPARLTTVTITEME